MRVAALDNVFRDLAGGDDYDGLALITGAGPGGGPQVRLRSDDLAVLDSFFAYEQTFFGGIFVAAYVLEVDLAGRRIRVAWEKDW